MEAKSQYLSECFATNNHLTLIASSLTFLLSPIYILMFYSTLGNHDEWNKEQNKQYKTPHTRGENEAKRK